MNAVRAVVVAPVSRRTWAEAAYMVVGLPFAALATVAAAPLVLGAPLSVLLIGLPLVAVTLTGARVLASVQRALAGALLGERVDAPAAAGPYHGLRGWLTTTLRDGSAWRAVGYFALKLPLAFAGTYLSFGLLITTVIDLTFPLRFARAGSLSARARAPFAFRVVSVRTAGGAWVVFAVGVAALLLLPWVVRVVVALDRRMVRSLLGTSTLAERVRTLEGSRAQAIDGSAAQLRRIERDLHDGAQVRIAALAMTLGQIKENLDLDQGPADLDRTRALVDTAHRTAKDALVELRDLARGIHPPVLDAGLDAALATLAAGSAVPVELSVLVPRRPSPAIETIAYYCAAELLANVAKHSGAHQAGVRVREPDSPAGDRLLLTVSDDGSGGARVSPGGGLAGLAERVGTVDGRLRIESPPGGPTLVTIDLPLHS